MELEEFLQSQKKYHESLDGTKSETIKELLKNTKSFKIRFNRKRQRAFKMLSKMYPEIKETLFVKDLISGTDGKAQFKHVYGVFQRYLKKLTNIQNAEEEKKTVEFCKDKRVKILSHGVNQLERLVRELRLTIKEQKAQL